MMLITVATFTSPWEAHIAKGRLEAEGIPAFIAHEHHVWADWMYSLALGGVKVQVPEAHAEEAARLLEQHMRGEFSAALPTYPGTPAEDLCPNCGSAAIRSRYSLPGILLLVLTFWLVYVFWPPRREIHVCGECEYRWRY